MDRFLHGSRVMSGTVYFLGAGASHEAGVPLTKHLLPAGHQLLQELSAYFDGHSSERVLADHPYLANLQPAHARVFGRVFDFIAQVFHGGELAVDALPELDELWSILELARRQRAGFGAKFTRSLTGETLNALMVLMYHLLVGCRVAYSPGDRRRADNQSGPEFVFAPPANPYHEFALNLGPRDVVVATNYDTLLDEAIWQSGREIDYGFLRPPSTDRPTVSLLKLHGSFNWLYCPTCDELRHYGTNVVANLPFEEASGLARCPNDGHEQESLIIPPSLVNDYGNRHLRNIWAAASRAMQSTSQLVFAGYSLSDADIYVKYLVRQATALPPGRHEGRSITMVNTSADAIAACQRLFGPKVVEGRRMPFGDFVGDHMGR
jgi:NAD-dependent SIR2 family protein deacetylase